MTGPKAEPLGAAFWRLWTSSALSNLADGVLKVALPLVAIRYTDSPGLVAGLALAMTLPWLLFALPVGALADRWDRRRTMVGANMVRATVLTPLAVALALDAGSIWLLYAVGFTVGVAETVYDTAGQSILPQVVDRRALPRANARLFAVELTANQFVGPPLGGFLVAVGTALAVGGPAGLWVLALGVLAFLPGSYRIERTGSTTLRTDIAEGLRYLWGHRLLRTLAAMVGAINFASNALFAVFVLYAVGPSSEMGLSDPGFGLLLTAFAAGSLLGALGAGWFARVSGRARALTASVLATGASILVPALSDSPWVIGAMFAIGGVGVGVWNVVTVSLRQRIAPDRLLGRVNSCYRLVAFGTMPLGALVGGVLGELFGLQAVFVVAGIIGFSPLLGMLVVTDRAMDDAERATS